MDFSVTILGSSAAIPKVNRNTTSQYVICKNRHILIDCGEGTQIQLRKFKLKLQSVQIILISHLHGDHILGLPGLVSSMQLLGRTSSLSIYGPKGISDFLLPILSIIGKGVQFDLNIVELEPNSNSIIFEDNCITISNFPLQHRIPTHGFLIKEKPNKRRLLKDEFDKTGVSVAYIQKLIQGFDIEDNNGVKVKYQDVTMEGKLSKSYAYCSDTCFTPKIIEYIADVDLLYHEATFLDKEADRASETYHSTAKQAASIALNANTKRLLLGHISARYNDLLQHEIEAKEIFENVSVVKDGDVYNL